MKTAIYPGSFDPITNGHIDVIERAAKLFDKVVVLISINSSKKPLFSLEERMELAKQSLSNFKNVEVDSNQNLTVEYAKKIGAISIIRGIRAVSDFEYEFQLSLINRKLENEITTVFLTPNEKYVYLNSSIVRELAFYGKDASCFVPKCVSKALIKKYEAIKKTES